MACTRRLHLPIMVISGLVPTAPMVLRRLAIRETERVTIPKEFATITLTIDVVEEEPHIPLKICTADDLLVLLGSRKGPMTVDTEIMAEENRTDDDLPVVTLHRTAGWRGTIQRLTSDHATIPEDTVHQTTIDMVDPFNARGPYPLPAARQIVPAVRQEGDLLDDIVEGPVREVDHVIAIDGDHVTIEIGVEVAALNLHHRIGAGARGQGV